MATELDNIFLIVTIVEFIIGMLGNAFIGLVNCSDGIKNLKVFSADFILTCLASSTIVQLLVMLFNSCLVEFDPYFYTTYRIRQLAGMLLYMLNDLTTWLATCLSVFYFFKIAHFPHSLFLWLRWRMNRVIALLLTLSLFLLIFECSLVYMLADITMNIIRKSNLTLYLDENKTLYDKFSTISTLLSLINLIPFSLCLTSLLFLFLSLVRHTRNLKLSSLGSRDSSTEAHRRAMKMVMSFLFLFIFHFFSSQMACWIVFVSRNNRYIKFIMLPFNVFPSCHSFILILGNSKLRQTAMRLLWHLRSHAKGPNPSPL
ncbi:taste receptor type 2 member 42 [Saimiri boliviensis]|uniref:taste receptor type 2 member 42 n=1 Tax=Saimiri boliviensis TaxID=27679 RepID=UPI00027F9FF8|nr:taste receptor type 2 member 42 [Saimiri boliviensis boliviensis]